MKGVVLNEVDRRGQNGCDFIERAPPIVVIAFEENFCAGKIVDPLEIGNGIFYFHGPRDVTGDEDQVLLVNHGAPMGCDFLRMASPLRAKVIHILVFDSET
jgi:hypothetical protein